MASRRQVLKLAGGAALIPLLPVTAFAADKVPLTDPAAVSLKYVEDASKAVGRADKMGVEAAKQNCTNCRFYGTDTDGWGPCMLFQNRLVAGAGWCSAWVPAA